MLRDGKQFMKGIFRSAFSRKNYEQEIKSLIVLDTNFTYGTNLGSHENCVKLVLFVKLV
jgi:hypothetical protein